MPCWLQSSYGSNKGTASARCLSSSARARGATCQLVAPTSSRRRMSLGAGAPVLAVSWEEAQHSSLLLRARRAALTVVCPCLKEGHGAGERPVSFGARPWCDVHAAIPNAKPASHVSRGAGAPKLAVSGEKTQHSSSCTRAPCRAGCGQPMPMEEHCVGERSLSFGVRPWCSMPPVRSNVKPAPNVTRRRRACARCLLRRGA